MSKAARTLVICSKSTWHPRIRREHALARLAARADHRVVFVERPTDVRALSQRQALPWVQGFRGLRPSAVEDGVEVVPRSTFVPGHRGGLAGRSEQFLLSATLARFTPASAVVVTTLPWQWAAARRLSGARHVYDCADDWAAMTPARKDAFLRCYREIAAEADMVVAASERLAELFPDARALTVVRNGTPFELLDPPEQKAEPATLVYLGTLSERFDSALVTAVLRNLGPEWSIDLYGQCQYAGLQERPADELLAMIEGFGDRVRWHGLISRSQAASAIDRAAVAVIPFRRIGAVTGGDAMKLYDYAARGRPIVSTSWTSDLSAFGPPHLYEAEGAEAFTAAVRAAATEPPGHALARRSWAEAQRWEARWPAWEKALFGMGDRWKS